MAEGLPNSYLRKKGRLCDAMISLAIPNTRKVLDKPHGTAHSFVRNLFFKKIVNEQITVWLKESI
jgi:hypothetical protein